MCASYILVSHTVLGISRALWQMCILLILDEWIISWILFRNIISDRQCKLLWERNFLIQFPKFKQWGQSQPSGQSLVFGIWLIEPRSSLRTTFQTPRRNPDTLGWVTAGHGCTFSLHFLWGERTLERQKPTPAHWIQSGSRLTVTGLEHRTLLVFLKFGRSHPPWCSQISYVLPRKLRC